MHLRQILENVDQIEIAIAARTEIDMYRLPHAACNCRLDDAFDRSKARPAGDAQNWSGMLFAQVGRAERPFDQHRIAKLQPRVDVLGRSPSGNSPDVEFQLSLARSACHRIVTGGNAREGEPCVLARREGKPIGLINGESDTFDVVRRVPNSRHAAVQPAARMGKRVLVATKPDDYRIRGWGRATGEEQPLRLLLVREREAARVKQVGRAAHQTRLAGPATAGTAAVRIGDAIGKRCVENRDAVRYRDGARGLAYLDMLHHGSLAGGGAETRCGSRSLYMRRETGAV